MHTQKINIIIAGRSYPLNVPINEEEALRKVGKQIENMIKDFEANFNIKDKQDALAMCALKLGVNAEMRLQNLENHVSSTGERLKSITRLLEDLEK